MIRNILTDEASFIYTAIVTIGLMAFFVGTLVWLAQRKPESFKRHEELPFDDEKK